MKNCINLVKKALNEHRRLTDNEIKIICIEMLQKYCDFPYVGKINFDYSRDYEEYKILAFYAYNESDLVFNIPKFNEIIFNNYRLLCERNENIFSFNEFYVWKQLMIAFHEIRHVIQFRAFSKRHIILQSLVASSFEIDDQEKYVQYYQLFPIEKDAEVFAFENVLRIFKDCNYFNSSILKYLYSQFMLKLLDGYNTNDNMDGNLWEFFKKVVGDESGYLVCQFYANELTLMEKISFNFPLNLEDIKYIEEALNLVIEGKAPGPILVKERKK